jgi:flagellin-like hook-associated protein FlgL
MHQADNFFSALTTLRDEFADGVVSQDVVSNTLTRLESLQGKLLQARGDAGGRIARFELLETRYQDESLFVEGLYGEKVSIDILEVTQRYLQQQQVYEAGLSVASRILGTSLFSFI